MIHPDARKLMTSHEAADLENALHTLRRYAAEHVSDHDLRCMTGMVETGEIDEHCFHDHKHVGWCGDCGRVVRTVCEWPFKNCPDCGSVVS